MFFCYCYHIVKMVAAYTDAHIAAINVCGGVAAATASCVAAFVVAAAAKKVDYLL